MSNSERSTHEWSGWLDLRLPTESPVPALNGLNRCPVDGRVRVPSDRSGSDKASVVVRSSETNEMVVSACSA